MSTELIELWHQRARPEPTHEDWNVQMGCHIEEFLEMLHCLRSEDGFTENQLTQLRMFAGRLSERLKRGDGKLWIEDREGFLDAAADQVVTAVGVAVTAGMKAAEAIDRVNSSNWSKFDVNGNPIKDANGKIAKGPDYKKPDLKGLFE